MSIDPFQVLGHIPKAETFCVPNKNLLRGDDAHELIIPHRELMSMPEDSPIQKAMRHMLDQIIAIEEEAKAKFPGRAFTWVITFEEIKEENGTTSYKSVAELKPVN